MIERMMMIIQVIWIIAIIINSAGLALHTIGIYAIIASKKRSNQTIILLNLSIVDIGGIIYDVANDIFRLIRFQEDVFDSQDNMRNLLHNYLPEIYQEISFTMYYAFGLQMVLNMIILTADRLVCVINPIKYKAYFKMSITRKILITSWMFSLFLGILYGTFPTVRFALSCLCVFIAVVFVILAIATYIFISHKIRVSN